MGTDIHLFAEKRVRGLWISADRWTHDHPDYDQGPIVARADRFYTGRDYRLFSILAGVRDSLDVRPVAEPKGFPDDASEEVTHEYGAWGRDAHTATWLTLRELMEYDWTYRVPHEGWVSLHAYDSWMPYKREEGCHPDGWLSGEPPDLTCVTEAEAAPILERYRAESRYGWSYGDTHNWIRRTFGREDIYVQCQWSTPLYMYAEKFLGHTVPRLWRLGAPDNVRVVFWFDN